MTRCRAGHVCQPPCPERAQAIGRGEFGWLHRYGYAFLPGHAPRRSMSSATYVRVYIERKDERHPNHTGEPVVWVTCPWCAGDLVPPGVLVDDYREAQREGEPDDDC